MTNNKLPAVSVYIFLHLQAHCSLVDRLGKETVNVNYRDLVLATFHLPPVQLLGELRDTVATTRDPAVIDHTRSVEVVMTVTGFD